jgi:hypothetical protein
MKSIASLRDIKVSRLQHRGPPCKATDLNASAVIRLLCRHPSVESGVDPVTRLTNMPVPTAATVVIASQQDGRYQKVMLRSVHLDSCHI